ncbi:MAG: hypothetical protein JWQ15_1039 [Marmoricola sp.]|nr:hypothetical protein [Marmoricola sp.]
MKKKLRVSVLVPLLVLVAVLAVSTFRQGSGPSAPTSAGSTAATSKAATDGMDHKRGLAGAPGAPAAATEPMNRAVISTGQVTLHPDSITRARSEAMRLVTSWGGTVADEQSSSDDRGRITESTLTLRVPSSRFAEAMTAFAGLGRLEQQSRKSEDVTTRVIDNEARVRAAERSIRQIESLLARARMLTDVIAIESDLARRQADLDSLKTQQAYLADQTSLSTIDVYLSKIGHIGPGDRSARGFLAGLDGGWTAMKGAVVVLLTVLGAALPFAVVLLLLGVPLWLVVRRRLGAGPVSAGTPPARSA